MSNQILDDPSSEEQEEFFFRDWCTYYERILSYGTEEDLAAMWKDIAEDIKNNDGLAKNGRMNRFIEAVPVPLGEVFIDSLFVSDIDIFNTVIKDMLISCSTARTGTLAKKAAELLKLYQTEFDAI